MNRTISTIAIVALLGTGNNVKKTTGLIEQHADYERKVESYIDFGQPRMAGLWFQDASGQIVWVEELGFSADEYCDNDFERVGCSIGNPIIR